MIKVEESYRYEKKFIIEDPSVNSLDNISNFFSLELNEVYPNRTVNSIYYDTSDLLLANQSKEGFSNRFKIRIRYYGDRLILKNPFLEIKYRSGNVGKKHRIKIDYSQLKENNFSLYYLFNNKQIPPSINDLIIFLKPIVFVSYERSYYIDQLNYFRFTFDTFLKFNNLFYMNESIHNSLSNSILYPNKVLEIKYIRDTENKLELITKKIPMRQSHFSKYRISLAELGLFSLD